MLSRKSSIKRMHTLCPLCNFKNANNHIYAIYVLQLKTHMVKMLAFIKTKYGQVLVIVLCNFLRMFEMILNLKIEGKRSDWELK